MVQEKTYKNIKSIEVETQDNSTLEVVVSLQDEVLVSAEYEFLKSSNNAGRVRLTTLGNVIVRLPKNDFPDKVIVNGVSIKLDLP